MYIWYMATGTKTGGRDFPPGVSGNPSGRPKLSEDVKEIRRRANVDVVRHLALIMAMGQSEFETFSARIASRGICVSRPTRLKYGVKK